MPLGLGLMALGALGLGELGWLNRVGLAVLLAVMMELGVVPRLADAPRMVVHRAVWWRRSGSLRDRCRAGSSASFVAIALLGTAMVATGPVTDGDALCYHLQVPKVFLMSGAAGVRPRPARDGLPPGDRTDLRGRARFPRAGGVPVDPVVPGPGLAANVTAMARPSLGRRAWWAGAIVLLAPAISNGMSAPLNDVALAAFGAAAIFAWTRLLDRPGPAAAAVAGVFAGLAMGVKYPALVLFGLMGGLLWVRGLRGCLPTLLGERQRRTPSPIPLPCGARATARPLRAGRSARRR